MDPVFIATSVLKIIDMVGNRAERIAMANAANADGLISKEQRLDAIEGKIKQAHEQRDRNRARLDALPDD